MVYLKAVEAYGFKSFADKTTVTFDKGLTAIVGPNGSGKSNITDAIRWVLGEQSAKNLRGSRMEDVIFSGAKNRSPLNYADVTLKLDNREHLIEADDEINVKRRLYRSGESEYFLNGRKVRLKDITELFLDSGLGKEAFSIISQGKVDEILNAKAEDRRHLIEEAAGVLKYKKRKKETTQKLEETMLNLSRVNDIIFDLEARVEPLAEEAAIAEEYQVLMAEMREADIAVTVHDIKHLKQEYAKVEKELTEFQEMILIKADKLERLQSKLDAIKEAQNEHKATEQSLNKQILQLTEAIERAQGQLGILNEKKDNQSKASARSEAEKSKLQSQIESQQHLLDQAVDEKQHLTALLKDHRTNERQLEIELTQISSDIESMIEETKDTYYEVLSRQTNSSNELKLIDKQLLDIKQFLDDNFNEDEAQQYDEVKARYDELVQKLEHCGTEIEATREQYRRLSSELNKKTQAYREQEEKLYQAYRYIDQMKTKHQSLLAMQEDFQGYYQGVKAVLKQNMPGIHGPVMAKIDIKKDYQLALDIALGAQLQHIITDDERSAREAIHYLKSKKLGRATFLPLSTIKPRIIADSELSKIDNEGYIGTLNQLVAVQQDYRTIIDYLMGRIIVVDTLVNANNVARQTQFKYRIVTLDGNTVNPGGSMTGGSVNQPSILLKQKEEVNELAQKIHSYEQSTAALETNISRQKEETTELNFQLERCKKEGEAQSEAMTDLIFNKGRLENELNALKQRQDKIKAVADKREEQEDLLEQQASLADRIASDRAALIQLEAKIAHYNDAKQNRKQLEQEINSKLSLAREQRIETSERLKYSDARIAEYRERIAALNEELLVISEQGELTSIEEIEAAISQHQRTLKESTAERLESKSQLEAVTRQLESDEQQFSSLSAQYNETQRQISGLENGIGEMKSRHSRIDVKLENLIFHLMENYHMTFEAALSHEHPDADIESLRTRVTLTKRSIEELGPVNISAIQQYKEVKERYDFLSEQEEDLKQAKQTLESVINDLDTEVSERFAVTFKAVQNNFQVVFSELFGGGTGELLLDSEDLLSAGVEMIIEPPGKKRQHLTLLSGGERALTAVALLFAILKVRSAPFVILDEVEAALDEANVLRFGSYLKNMSADTQFIVITHRKGTMEASDRLYGVTMQNSGITQLVSVNLNELSNEKVEELTK